MSKSRRKLTAALNDFQNEIARLKRFDEDNQSSFNRSPSGLTKHQLHLLTEAIFFAAYRSYEGFIRDVFLLYCLEKSPSSGRRVRSYLQPKNFNHAEVLIKSSMPFLSWTSPAEVIKRSETYLKDGFPIKLPYSTNNTMLDRFKRIRNHIAHDSSESLNAYKKVLRQHFGTTPLRIPPPGEYLLLIDRNDRSKYYLQSFFESMNQLAISLT